MASFGGHKPGFPDGFIPPEGLQNLVDGRQQALACRRSRFLTTETRLMKGVTDGHRPVFHIKSGYPGVATCPPPSSRRPTGRRWRSAQANKGRTLHRGRLACRAGSSMVSSHTGIGVRGLRFGPSRPANPDMAGAAADASSHGRHVDHRDSFGPGGHANNCSRHNGRLVVDISAPLAPGALRERNDPGPAARFSDHASRRPPSATGKSYVDGFRPPHPHSPLDMRSQWATSCWSADTCSVHGFGRWRASFCAQSSPSRASCGSIFLVCIRVTTGLPMLQQPWGSRWLCSAWSLPPTRGGKPEENDTRTPERKNFIV